MFSCCGLFFGLLPRACHSWIGDLARDTTWGGNKGGRVRIAARTSPRTRAMPVTSATARRLRAGPPVSAPVRPSGCPRRRIATTTAVPPRSPGCKPGGTPILATVSATLVRRTRAPGCPRPPPRSHLPRPCRSRQRARACPPRRWLLTRRTPPRSRRYRSTWAPRYKMSWGHRYKISWLLNLLS